jgi:hypothetical protein
MGIVKCKECGGKVSSTAELCPQCGFRLKKKPSGCIFGLFKLIGGLVGAIVALIFVTGLMDSNKPDPHVELRNQCKQLADSYPNRSEQSEVFDNCIKSGEAMFKSKGIK